MTILRPFLGNVSRLFKFMLWAVICQTIGLQAWAQPATVENLRRSLSQYHSTIKGIDLSTLVANKANTQSSEGRTPSTAAFQQRVFSGAAPDDEFGNAVSAAGDFDGDGFGDFLIAAYQNDAAGNNAGRVYLYLGGLHFDSIADLFLTGEAPGDQFGRSVAPAGDVNGDGYDDIIIGAPLNNGNGPDAGRAYLFWGGPSLDSNADVILDGEVDGDRFGISVASAGDVNSDGYSDVIVGAWLSNAVAPAAGRAYIYFGGPAMDSAPDVILSGSHVADQFGVAVEGAGDLNDDGHDDVVVGALFHDATAIDAGAAFVYFGGPDMNETPDVTLTGEQLADLFGVAVKGGGDVNGDGVSDLIVGSVLNDAGGIDAGRTYIYFGGRDFDDLPDVVLTGLAPGDQFGNAISNLADVNGDGYHDILVAAFNHDAGGANTGEAYVYFGGPAIDDVADAIFKGENSFDEYGSSLASAGDVNGDGRTDFLAGAPGHDGSGAEAGRAYLYLNAMTGRDLRDNAYFGETTGDLFGFSVALVRDIDADGFDDVLIGAPGNGDGGIIAGKASIFFGGQIESTAPDWVATGSTSNMMLGFDVAEAGDVNGDSYHDFLIGAPVSDGAMPNSGRAFVYFGGPGLDNIADLVLDGGGTFDLFGSSLAAAGDVNGDGFSDILVGASENDAGGINAGRCYLYFGGPGVDNVADVVLTGFAAGEKFGVDVSSAGDFNGDGFGDIIIGAWKDSDTKNLRGCAYLFFGGSTINTTADLVFEGQKDRDGFGVSVAGAGDVNRDGFADVMVGAIKDEASGKETGRVYIYYGGLRPDDQPDVILNGEHAGDDFGRSVSPAGDLNRDGYSDIIVGAARSDTRETNLGRAYVFFGGADMDASSDVILKNGGGSDAFGFSVSGGRDLNGDGLHDFLVGAYRGSGVAANTGRVDLFLNAMPPVVPRMMAAVDVPHDQGGRLILKWVRSGYDAQETGRVTAYMVQRSLPPGVTGFAWENIGSISATREPFYSFTAATLFDSSESASGLHYFRVIARSTNPEEIWKAAPISGYSVDNLPPSPVQNLQATPNANGTVQLTWQPDEGDPDVSRFEIYRSDSEDFRPNVNLQIGVSTDTFYVDSSPEPRTASYYHVVTVDHHGNKSRASSTALSPTHVAESKSELPARYSLAQNYPNPFNPATTIQFSLPTKGEVKLTLYDLLGNQIMSLIDETYQAGIHRYLFDGSDLASGVYVYQIQIGEWQQRRKMILLK